MHETDIKINKNKLTKQTDILKTFDKWTQEAMTQINYKNTALERSVIHYRGGGKGVGLKLIFSSTLTLASIAIHVTRRQT